MRLGKCLNFNRNVFVIHDHHDHDDALHKAAMKVNFVQPNIVPNYSKCTLLPMVMLSLW